jgi:hypothetical protein
MRSRRCATTLCSVLAVAALASACGGDPGDAVGAGGEAPTPDLASTLPPAGGTGAGTIVIGSDSYGFDADVCALTPVSHRGSAYDFYVHGSGTRGGESFEVEVLRTAGDAGTRIETVSITFGAQDVITANNVVPNGQVQDRLAVSDTLLSGTGEFASTDDVTAEEGRVDLTCS